MHTVIWKRIAISIGLTFAVLVSSVPLNLISVPQASAASSVYNDLSLEDKAKFYAYYWLMQTCFKDSAIETNAAKVAEGKLFYDKPINTGLSAFAGRQLVVDEAVYESEHDTGDRNRALAHLTRSAGVLAASVDVAVETYFRQCSLVVTARDVAIMSATLANAGRNPVTHDRIPMRA